MLFHLPLASIKEADVNSFCDEYPEGIRVEYKRDFPADLAKGLASLANTLGGVVLIGAEALKTNNRPKTPISGVPTAPGLEERVLSIASQAIYPPILPTVGVIPLASGNSAIVIRVDESPFSPHTIDQGRRVYVRTGSISTPIDLADLDRIQFLLERRTKADTRREALLQTVQEPFRHVCFISKAPRDVPPLLRLGIVPLYPHRPIIAPDEAYAFSEQFDALRPLRETTTRVRYRVPGGVVLTAGTDAGFFLALNEYGAYFSVMPLPDTTTSDGSLLILLHELGARLTWLLRFGLMFLDAAKFSGYIQLTCEVSNVLYARLRDNTTRLHEEIVLSTTKRDICLSSTVQATLQTDVEKCRSDPASILIDLLKLLSWNLGQSIDQLDAKLRKLHSDHTT